MGDDRKICCLVPARAGSKGLPDKNLSKISGRSIVAIAVKLGLDSGHDVAISTDIEDVLTSYAESEVRLRKRPSALCGDDVPMAPVITDAIHTLGLEEHDIILLQPTSPCRTRDQLEACVAQYRKEKATLLLSVTKAPSSVLKYYVKEESLRPISDVNYLFANRQTLPPVYRPNGAFYIFKGRGFLDKEFDTERLALFEMDEATSLDIDNADDLASTRSFVNRILSKLGLN